MNQLLNNLGLERELDDAWKRKQGKKAAATWNQHTPLDQYLAILKIQKLLRKQIAARRLRKQLSLPSATSPKALQDASRHVAHPDDVQAFRAEGGGAAGTTLAAEGKVERLQAGEFKDAPEDQPIGQEVAAQVSDRLRLRYSASSPDRSILLLQEKLHLREATAHRDAAEERHQNDDQQTTRRAGSALRTGKEAEGDLSTAAAEDKREQRPALHRLYRVTDFVDELEEELLEDGEEKVVAAPAYSLKGNQQIDQDLDALLND